MFSGIPETVPVYTVNRQCSSGLQALLNIAGKNLATMVKSKWVIMQECEISVMLSFFFLKVGSEMAPVILALHVGQ